MLIISHLFRSLHWGGVIPLAFFSIYMPALQAQQFEGAAFCGTEEPTQNFLPPPESLNHCFDVQTIFDNCTKVWLRVNIHFFLDNNCEGNLHPTDPVVIPIEKAYQVAEDLIDSANDRLENNREQWNQVPWGIPLDPTRHCIPFRYLISGVYVHCNTTATNTSASSLNYFQNNFGVNTSTEYNCFIAEYVGPATGVASQPGNKFAVENFSTGNFNHEMGHCLNLRHSWLDDLVDDTPPIRFDYDFNCDEDFNDFFAGNGAAGDENDRQCWIYYYDDDLEFPPPIDYNGDGIIDIPDPCDPDPPCLAYPCCEWKYNNNNIMAYSSYIDCCSAYTPGQITRALNLLSTDTYCEYIEDITDTCHPPKANAAILPTENAEDCNYCLHFEHSMNETYYLLEFMEGTTLVHSTGWIDGQAGVYCISQSPKFPNQYQNGFLGGHTYTAKLTVENHCGDAETREITFTLPVLNCVSDLPPFEFKDQAPNPFWSSFTYDYETKVEGDLKVWLISLADRNNAQLIEEENELQPGVYQKVKSTTTLSSGVYALVALFNGAVYSINIVKS